MDWLRYSNQGAIRSKPLSGGLLDALSFLPEMGLEMEVFSGGQDAKGSGGARTGSMRHDHGNAADVFFYKDGQKLDWANPTHQPIFQEVVQRSRQNGITGIGAGDGYMQPGSMHIGFGDEAVWGAGGRSVNAPEWLRAAYHGQPGHQHVQGDESQQIANDTMAALGQAPQQSRPLAAPNRSTTVSSRNDSPSLLGSIGNDEMEREMNEYQPEKASGLMGKLFPNMTADRQDRLALAFGGLSMNPNQALMSTVQDRLSDRRDARRDRKQGTVTAEWLARQPGGEQYAEAINSGALPATLGLQMWQAQMKGQDPAKGVVVSGQLVNPITGEQIGDYRTPDGGSENDKTIARIKSAYGVDDQTAVGIVDGVLRVSRDPYDQSVMVTNLATGQSYSPQVQPQNQQPPASGGQSPQPTIETQQLPPAPDASNGFGVEGVIKRGINSASDFVGAGTPFKGVQQTQSDFAVLREGLVNDISQGYGRQPPSWLLQNIQDLTPQAGGMMGPEAAQSKLGALQRSFQTELQGVQQQLQTRIAPEQERALSERAAALQSALGKVQNALGQFGGSGGTGTTRSGINWSVE